MEDHTTNHALTEVALALAMAFFSIMILAMVSMSIPRAPDTSISKSTTTLPSDSVKMQQNDPSQATASKKPNKNAEVTSKSKQQFVFYANQRFYNQQLQVIDLATLGVGEVVLALSANLTVAEALRVKGQINRPDLVITQYNQQWQQRLETLK